MFDLFDLFDLFARLFLEAMLGYGPSEGKSAPGSPPGGA
jgi:hypothetical protein